MVPRIIIASLAKLRRRERLLALALGLAQWVAIVAIALAAASTVDWLIDRDQDTPGWVRRLLFVLQLVLAIGTGFWLVVWPQLRRLTDDTLALWVEERQPGFAHRLITAVQLARPGARSEGMSAELIQIVTHEAEKRASTSDFANVADHRRLRRAALVMAPVLALTAFSFVLAPHLIGVLLVRQMLADVDIPHSVAIKPLKLEEVRPAGEKVTLQFRVRGAELNPDWEGDVFVKPQGQPRDRYPLEFARFDGDDAIFQAAVAPSSANLTFSARLRDGRMRRPGHITMVPRPIVIEQLAWVQLPAFCGLKPDGSRYEQPQGRGDIVGIPDSSARIAIRTQKPVRRAYLQILGPEKGTQLISEEPAREVFKREVVLTLDADSSAASGIFDLRRDESAYRIVTVDEYGFDNVPAPRRGLQLVPEEPPQVVLLKEQMPPVGPIAAGTPWEDFEVDGLPVVPGKKIRVGYAAQAPFGLGRARFLYRILRKTDSGNDEAKDEPWRVLDLPEIKAGDKSGAFDPKRGAFEHSPFEETIYFHAVPSADPERLLGRTLGGGRFDFETKGIADGKGGLMTLRVGDQLEFCVEVFASADPNSKRPSARSDIRTRPIISVEDLFRWLTDAAQEEQRLKDLNSKQRGVFELR